MTGKRVHGGGGAHLGDRARVERLAVAFYVASGPVGQNEHVPAAFGVPWVNILTDDGQVAKLLGLASEVGHQLDASGEFHGEVGVARGLAMWAVQPSSTPPASINGWPNWRSGTGSINAQGSAALGVTGQRDRADRGRQCRRPGRGNIVTAPDQNARCSPGEDGDGGQRKHHGQDWVAGATTAQADEVWPPGRGQGMLDPQRVRGGQRVSDLSTDSSGLSRIQRPRSRRI